MTVQKNPQQMIREMLNDSTEITVEDEGNCD